MAGGGSVPRQLAMFCHAPWRFGSFKVQRRTRQISDSFNFNFGAYLGPVYVEARRHPHMITDWLENKLLEQRRSDQRRVSFGRIFSTSSLRCNSSSRLDGLSLTLPILHRCWPTSQVPHKLLVSENISVLPGGSITGTRAQPFHSTNAHYIPCEYSSA